MADKKQLGFRAQTQLAESVEDYAEERGISQSEALRRIVERGLENMDKSEEAMTDGGRSDADLAALNVMSSAAVVALVGGVAGFFSVFGISLTPWSLAGPLFVIGGIAAVIAVVASVVYFTSSNRMSGVGVAIGESE